ncbi:MlaD family protein [Plasticicumulans acidivorans]|uniref:Phospholipid/cholesterol/gamma-HCH transport system substrate-binding protein n=1 Tax=Plasticicumulans acidivorans TaxID=886464 RepID=A0A317MS13_9GAMM|nr:MlaD family protein [Plasticicumulans acidivorans]PWV59274.1 phospholipid/cholesterol/gamma-HCH transport system substrate-binding protein [Plasticicumulans acidivorans]
MDTKVNYALVGAFVLALGAALLATLLWLSVGTQEKVYDTYRLYFRDSVAGLNPKAAVRLRGVTVGEVGSIELDRTQPDRVIVDLKIEHGTPILASTRAVLATQGLTGIAAVELAVDDPHSPPLERQGKEPYPVIPTGPSLVQRLDNAVTQVLGDFARLSARLEQLLGDDNQQAVHALLSNLSATAAALARQADGLDGTMQDTRKAAQSIRELAQRLQTTAGSVERTAQAFTTTAQTTTRAVADSQRELRQLTGSAGPELTSLLAETRRLVEVLDRVGSELERDPRMLLFGRQRGPAGPGE